MFPLLEMKNYSRYIVKYLLNVLQKFNDKNSLTKDEYFLILDTVYTNKKNFPNDLKKDFTKIIPSLKTFLFKSNNDNYKQSFSVLFKKLASTNNNKPYQNCLCDVICEVFNREPATLNSWENCYKNHVEASAILLNYIGK